jgi:diketogulonate reductase-like aldo/keto reductase
MIMPSNTAQTMNVALNNGLRMPFLGFGTYQITEPEECARTVKEAIDAGYRLIDTAKAYGNEAAVGEGLRNSGVARHNVFVTTKLWFKDYGNARQAFEESLERLGLEYLDLVVLHWPFGDTYAAYRELEKLYSEKLVRAIVVSNFEGSQLVDLVHFAEVVPAVDQVETNLYAQQKQLHSLMEELGVQHQGYAPFGQGRMEAMFESPEVTAIAKQHDKSAHQIALRFFVQQGISVIPKSIHKIRMEQNLNIFDFKLTDEEMEALHGIDRDNPLIGCAQDTEKAKQAMTW